MDAVLVICDDRSKFRNQCKVFLLLLCYLTHDIVDYGLLIEYKHAKECKIDEQSVYLFSLQSKDNPHYIIDKNYYLLLKHQTINTTFVTYL